MRRLLLPLLILLGLPILAEAQTGACTVQNTPTGVVFGRSLLTFTSADHNAVDPAGALKVADYFGEVRVKDTPTLVTDFTVPKNSVTPVTGAGIPANCYQTLLPAMGSGLLPTATYTLTLFSRNPNGTKSDKAPTADFFLSSASVPASPGNLRLVTP